MKIERNKIIQAITNIMAGVAKKDIITNLQYIVCDKGSLYSYNSKYAVVVDMGIDIDFVVDGKSLYEALKKGKTKEVEFSIEENVLILTMGKTVVEIPLLKDDKILQAHDNLEYDYLDYLEISEEFLTGLSLCYPAASTNMNNIYGMYCIKVTSDFIFATDSVRMAAYMLDIDIDDFYLPAEAVPVIIAMNPSEMCVTKNWCFFRNEKSDIIGCKLINVADIFPTNKQISKYLNQIEQSEEYEIHFSKAILEELPIIGLFEEDSHVTVSVSKEGELEISAESIKGFSSTIDTLKGYQGKEVEFMIDISLLNEVIKKDMRVCIGDFFLYINEENFKYLAAFKE